MSSSLKDLYETLEISRDASGDVISKSYKRLAKTHHPDKGGNIEEFKKIQQAYETLNNPDARRIYDFTGSIDGGAGNGGGGGGMPPGFSFGGGGGNEFANLFSQFFAGGQPTGHFGGHSPGSSGRRHGKPSPKQQPIQISLDHFYKGITLHSILNRNRFCSSCSGLGAKNISICTKCRGQGVIIQHMMVGPGMVMENRSNCPDCNGVGQKKEDHCGDCEGRGSNKEIKNLEVKIKPGMAAGDRLVFPGEGSDEMPWNQSADLVILLESAESVDYSWKRKGDDLFHEVSIGLCDALCGKKIELFGHPSKEPVFFDIHAGIADREEIIVGDRGMPCREGRTGFGSLIITVRIVMTVEDRVVLERNKEMIRAMFVGVVGS